jgi:hypothetical protein
MVYKVFILAKESFLLAWWGESPCYDALDHLREGILS